MLYSTCASAKHTSWERDGPNSAPVSEPERRGLADPRFSDTQSSDMPSLAFTAPFSRGTLRGVVPTRDFRQEIRDIAGIFLVGGGRMHADGSNPQSAAVEASMAATTRRVATTLPRVATVFKCLGHENPWGPNSLYHAWSSSHHPDGGEYDGPEGAQTI